MAYCGEGGTISSLTDITELKWKVLEPIYLDYSLEAAISEFEMVNDSLERQVAELVSMAKPIDPAHTQIKKAHIAKIYLNLDREPLFRPWPMLISY